MSDPAESYRDKPDTRKIDAITLRNAMVVLLSSEGWRMLEKTLLGQSTTRQLQLLQPLASADGMYAQEYKKGEAAAFRVAAALPGKLHEDASLLLTSLTQGDDESSMETIDDE